MVMQKNYLSYFEIHNVFNLLKNLLVHMNGLQEIMNKHAKRKIQITILSKQNNNGKTQKKNLEKNIFDFQSRIKTYMKGYSYNIILFPISLKQKKVDGSVLFFQEKGGDGSLTNLQQLWDELSIDDKQIYGQRAQQNYEDTIKASIEEYITEYQNYINKQNEKPQDLQFIQKIEEEQDEIDQIDIIIGIKQSNGKKEYLVRFKGKTGKDAKWFPKKKLRKVKEIVKKFEETYFKQLFQDNESSSGFDSTPPEQIFQKIEKVDQKQQQTQQIEEMKEYKETKKVKPKQISSKQPQLKQEKNGTLKKSITPQKVNTPKMSEVENTINQSRRKSQKTNSISKTKPNVNQNKKQDQERKIQKQYDQLQDDRKQQNKQISIEKITKSGRETKSSQQDQPKQVNKASQVESVSKRVKKQLSDQSKIKQLQQSQKRQENPIKQENQSQKQQSIEPIEPVITKRQCRNRDNSNSNVHQLSTTKINVKNQKQKIKINKLSTKTKLVVQKQSINNSNLEQSNKNSRRISVSQQKQSKNQQQSGVSKTRSTSVQSNKQQNNQSQQKEQISNKIQSRSVDAIKNITPKSKIINKVSLSLKRTIKSSKSPKKVCPTNTTLNKIQLNEKLKRSQTQLKNVKQQVDVQNTHLISAKKSNQDRISQREVHGNTRIKSPMKINKRIQKNTIKNKGNQKEKIIEKEQKKDQVYTKNNGKNNKAIFMVAVRQTRSKKSKDTVKRKH